MKVLEEHFLNLGDVVATPNEAIFTCYGLGSCLGLFLYDRRLKIGAGAHIVYSGETEKESSANAFTALEKSLKEMEAFGSDKNFLRAKITGGSNVLSTGFKIGEKNIQHVLELLKRNKIYLAGSDVGGNSSRSARFDTRNGSLTVRAANKEYVI